MSEFLVVVVNRTKARFFTLEKAQVPEYESGPNLSERKELLNPTQDFAGKDLWSNVKTGRNKGSGGQAHAYDDHRQSHLIEFERRFAQAIADEIVHLSQQYHARRLVLVAEPQILGLLRETLAPQLLKDLKVQELAKDLCHLKPLELHKHLAAKELLPARQNVSG
ncbi:host attachment protein [Pleurocapsales cyanobacterium LEGE 06147]|nr:host attachment protein [Pleurocapsales cyanobacterium LEGE 06147]